MKKLKDRTKELLWNVGNCSSVPHTREYNAYINQFIRSSSSVGANYRTAQRAKSDVDFINKLKIVEEEANKSIYFLELLVEVLENNKEKARLLHAKCNEINSIVVAAINTTPKNFKNDLYF